MSLFFQENIAVFLIGAGILGFIAGHVLHPCIRYLPAQLEKNWRRQAWRYLYPDTQIPIPIQREDADSVSSRSNTSRDFLRDNALTETSVLKGERYVPLISPKLKPFSLKKMQCTACVFAAVSVCIAYAFGPHWTALANIVLMWGLLLLAYMDYHTYLLPDCLTIPFVWLGLFCNTFAVCVPLRDAVLGAIIGYSSLWLIAFLFRSFRNKEGMGQGDFKLLAVLGAWWGWSPLLFIVMLASTLGAAVGLLQIARGQAAEKPIAFGPYLIFAGFISLFLTHIPLVLEDLGFC
jgi:leader peptidase (prepilin peptidase)/N-methyltransferase